MNAMSDRVTRRLTPYERHAETYDWAGLQVREYVTMRYPIDIQVLDVGAGRGKYRDLLPEYPNIDAVEIYQPTVDEENLRERYRTVFAMDVAMFADSAHEKYDVIIMGDVLEHMETNDAHDVLDLFMDDGSDVVVIVPYLFPQDEEDGNVHQRHVQDDLTPNIMMVRYPELQLVALETRAWRPYKGMYIRE
jgi:hypothetical protein